MEHISFFFSTAIQLFALMTPPVVLSAFISATRIYDEARKKRIALRASLWAFIIGLALYLLGDPLFRLLGISLDAFRIGAGALLFLNALAMMNDVPTISKPRADQDISIVPLAIPLCMGPATIGAIMVWGAADHGLEHRIITLLALAAASASIYLMLLTAEKAERFLRPTGIAVMSKLTGLLVAAIAAQMIFTGIKAFLLGT